MKRIMAALFILLMTAAMVFAGGGGQSSSSSAAAALPSTGKLVVEMFDRGTDGGRTLAYDNAWTSWIKDKVKRELNIDVTFQAVGRWSENTDIVNMMAGRNAPDLCYTYNGGMIDNFRDYGGILNLAPYIDTYLPDLKNLLGEDPVFPGKDFIRRDEIYNTGGEVYKIASARVALAQRNIFIRKDWLDKLGLAVPTNINQFHDALVAFRDRDPGGVGASRVIPYFQGSDARWGLADLMNNGITRGLSDRETWINSVADRNIAMPGYKDGVKLMNQWYNERLIYQDFPLVTVAEDGNNILKSGAAGAFGANWDLPYRTDYNINAELARNVPGASFIAIDIGLANKSMMDKTGLYMFIPTFSRSQGDALKYLNWLSKFENFNYLQIGERGRNHNIVDGVPQILATPSDPRWIQNSTQNIDITMPLNGVELGSAEQNSKVLALSYAGTPADIIVKAYDDSVKNARAAIVHPAILRITEYTQTLQDKADALLAQAIRAPTAQFDSVWDAGYRDWMASGAQEVINERTSQWPR